MACGSAVPVRVGCHVSIAGSIDRAVERARERGCDVFQIFTGNPRGWAAKELAPDASAAFSTGVRAAGMDPVVAHMPYLPNLASPKKEVYKKSVAVMIRELDRCTALGIPYLVTHLGSHLGSGASGGIARLVDGISRALAESRGTVTVLLENTAGTAHSVGGTFEEIREVLDGIGSPDQVGVCFDTCHAWAAGYDLSGRDEVAETLRDFDSAVGCADLRVVHVNDCKGARGSHLDRHEHVGLGAIGEDGFRAFLAHPAVRACPLICETPVDARRSDADNISRVRELANPCSNGRKGSRHGKKGD
ncbi:MAG: endonuclease [Methanoculleus sp. SDB]|nr:MAG: endonuclease [Methanoculleus sp. SDB]